MRLLSALAVLLVSLLVAPLAVRLGVPLCSDVDDVDRGRALAVGLVGGVAWVLLAPAVGTIPVLGGLVVLGSWIAVVYALTPGDVRTAALIGLVTWAFSVVLLHGFALTARC